MATEQQKEKAKKIINTSVLMASTVSGAMAQAAIFLVDNVPLVDIYMSMIISLGKIFNQFLNKQTAHEILQEGIQSICLPGTEINAIKGITPVKAIFGIIPAVGNLINATISGSYTEQLGWWCFNYFDKEFPNISS